MTERSILKNLPYWEQLTEEEKEIIENGSVVRTYEKGSVIHGGEHQCLGQVLLVRGAVRMLAISEEGREITLFKLKEGDACIIPASCIFHGISMEMVMMAEENTEFLVVNAGLYETLMEKNSEVRCFSYALASERMSTVALTLAKIVFSPFDQRLAGYLVEYHDQTGKKELRMTQEALARDVNTAREVVARKLHQFAADGLIELRRGVILLKNPEGLREIAEALS